MYNFNMKLTIKNLSVNVGEKAIIDDFNLTVNQGQVLAILGPNGHGKSTILKSIINHYELTKKGTIKLDDTDITHLSPDEIAHHKIFYCTQNPIEIPGVSQVDLYKSILNAYSPQPLKIADIYKKIHNALAKLNFSEEILTRSVNDGFSGGEKKKNEMVQMLLMEPEIILLDEIDSGLDIDTLNQIADIIKEQIALKKTVIFITHNKTLIDKLQPDKVIVIADGKKVKEGDIQIAYDIFANGFNKFFKANNISLNKPQKDNLLMHCGAKHESHHE